jgi:hypothetical protein
LPHDSPPPSPVPETGDGLVGTWKLKSFLVEDVATGERKPVLGEHPQGYLVFLPEGRLISVVTADTRRPSSTETERAAAFRSMLAYAGRYRVEADRFIATVDVSWDESWLGSEQVRFFCIGGDRLSIETAPQLAFGPGDGPKTRGIVVWQREH